MLLNIKSHSDLSRQKSGVELDVVVWLKKWHSLKFITLYLFRHNYVCLYVQWQACGFGNHFHSLDHLLVLISPPHKL